MDWFLHHWLWIIGAFVLLLVFTKLVEPLVDAIIPPEEQNIDGYKKFYKKQVDMVTGILRDQAGNKSIVAEDGITVAYEADGFLTGLRDDFTQTTDSKIRELIKNNRDTDFALYEKLLQIKIIAVERGPSTKTASEPPQPQLPPKGFEF